MVIVMKRSQHSAVNVMQGTPTLHVINVMSDISRIMTNVIKWIVIRMAAATTIKVIVCLLKLVNLHAEIAHIHTLANSATNVRVDIGSGRMIVCVIRLRVIEILTVGLVTVFLRIRAMSVSALQVTRGHIVAIAHPII